MQALSLEMGLRDMVNAITKIAKSINNVARAIENKSIRETEIKLILKASDHDKEIYNAKELLITHTLDL